MNGERFEKMESSKIEDSLTKESIIRLIALARTNESKNHAVKFPIKEEVKALLENEMEDNFDGYSFQIDIYAIKHILKEHSNQSKEDSRGQIAVNDEDILLVLDVLQLPDLILNSGKNKLGKETITFIKQIDNRYVIIQEVRTGRKTVALNSMRIFKTKRTN
ncbi:MAG: hypothetical protein U5M51_03560 [Emticicia sp.]|nr:hypothetical protein [Emticicia sp.]